MNLTQRFASLALALLASTAAFANTWTSDPVVAGQGCDDLEYLQIAEFLDKYYTANEQYSSNEDQSSAAMLTNYTISSALVNRSQACLADALALKELADELREQQAVLTSGTSMSRRQVKRQRKLTSEANEEIQNAASRLDELTPEQRDRFGKGSAAYLAGTYATAQLFRGIDGYLVETAEAAKAQAEPEEKSRFSRIPGLGRVTDAAKGAVGVFQMANGVALVFKGLQDHTIELYKTSQFLRAYSDQNAVELPDDATDQLAEVSDWV